MNYKTLPHFLVSVLLCACTQKTENTSNIDAQINQYLCLTEARRSPNPKMDQIKEHYNALSDILTQAGLKNQADQYFAQAENSPLFTPPMQGVEKTFQQALVILIHEELEQVSGEDSAQHIDNAFALYGGLKSTAERRGQYFESDTLFTGIIEKSFKNLKKGSDRTGNTQKIYAAIDDVYFLSVLYELEGLAAKRGVDEIIVQEKQIEGSTFYEIIRSSAKDQAASETVRAEWAKGGNDLDIGLIKENMKIAFPEKSVHYQIKF